MLARFRSFPRSVQLLLVNQLTINTGFYMLMPYLAAYLSGELALATWLVGLILGVRNFSQQGMFLLGGALADRLGYKPLIVAGCALRTVGFALLGAVDSLWALVLASAATGFAGALFNPAVRAFLAKDAGKRRVEAFALQRLLPDRDPRRSLDRTRPDRSQLPSDLRGERGCLRHAHRPAGTCPTVQP